MAPLLSREAMERAIKEGGSVLYQGRTLTRLDELPAEAELAQGDAGREAAAREALDSQIAALLAQRALVGGTAPVPSGEATAGGGETPPQSTSGGAATPPAATLNNGPPSATTPPPAKTPKEPKKD